MNKRNAFDAPSMTDPPPVPGPTQWESVPADSADAEKTATSGGTHSETTVGAAS